MLCAISGEAPQNPVLSQKSGNVYEKRLIESYISENGTEPTTGESLSVEDLIAVRGLPTVRPRPPTLTSIPALLGVFQEEWDALALETFTLQQNLAQTRQELSTALYQNDAAIRVIARLTRERDEARDALAKVNVGATAANGVNGDTMQIDNAPLPSSIIAKIESTQAGLMKTRRKRPIPEGWATEQDITNYKAAITTQPVSLGSKTLSINNTGDLILIGGADGTAGVYSVSQAAISQTFPQADGAITTCLWSGNRAVFGLDTGRVSIFEDQEARASIRVHSGAVTGLTLHPSGDIAASASSDKSYALYDMQSLQVLTQVFTDSELTCAQFHPDGHLIAVGGSDGQLRFYDVKSGALAGAFQTGSALKALYFSENGTWVAAANSGSSIVGIWDLRKVGQADEPIKTLDFGSPVESLSWDYSAQFLSIGGPGGIAVQQYTKSTKEWSELLRTATPSSAVAWGPAAQSIFAVSDAGVMTVFQAVR